MKIISRLIKPNIYSLSPSNGIHIIPKIKIMGIRWKDKFDTPRVEITPNIHIMWLTFSVMIHFGSENAWEQWLWYKCYSNKNMRKAKETWPWEDGNNNSTWNLT